jgi:ketosteroid isomerase-like protein
MERSSAMDDAQRNKQLVLDAYSGRPGALLAALAPDIEYTLMGSTHRFARTFRGRDDVVQNLFAQVGTVLAGGRMTPVNAVAEGDQVVVEFAGEGRTKDGREYNNRYCSVFRVADGRITHIREYLDTDLTRSVFG